VQTVVAEKRASLTWCKGPVNRSGPQKGTKRTYEEDKNLQFYIALSKDLPAEQGNAFFYPQSDLTFK
jgi:hypothetical protein